MRCLLTLALLLPACAHADPLLDTVAGTWAIGSTSNCARNPYEWTVLPSKLGARLTFRDRAGQTNTEQVDTDGQDGFTTTILSSPDVPAGTRWAYEAAGHGVVAVRNFGTGRQITLLRCALTGAVPKRTAGPAPTFAEPLALVAWLIGHSGRGFVAVDEVANETVFSPGLRAALRASLLRSRQRNEPPCGANGDIILDTQDGGTAQNLRLSVQPTAADRATVSASYDVDGFHRDRRYFAINLDRVWKLENIIEANVTSLRRSLDCRP